MIEQLENTDLRDLVGQSLDELPDALVQRNAPIHLNVQAPPDWLPRSSCIKRRKGESFRRPLARSLP